jgi:magnesium transporter
MSPPLPPDDPLRRLLEIGTDEEIVLVLAGKDPQEVADVLEQMPEDVSMRAFEALGTLSQAQVLREIDDDDVRDDLIEGLSDDEIADIAEVSVSDDATDLVDDLPDERRERVMAEIEPERRAEIRELRSYGPETAGGIMQTELLAVDERLTVGEAIDVVRREYSPAMGDLYDLWVVNEAGQVKGRVRSRQLLTRASDLQIREIMKRDVHTVPVLMDQEKIVDLVQDYNVASVAVVDEDERLVGRIMVDDILDVMEEEATEDVALQAGTRPEDVYSRSVSLAIRSRFPWLMATFGGGLISVALIMTFEEDLIKDLPIFAAAIPIIMGMSGNVGTQAATVTVRGIAVGDIEWASLRAVVGKEMLTGAAFALAFGLMLYPMLFVVASITGDGIPPDLDPMLVVLVPAIALTLTIAAASAIGTMVPLILERFGRDPAVASAPFITTAVDVLAISLLAGVKLLLL